MGVLLGWLDSFVLAGQPAKAGHREGHRGTGGEKGPEVTRAVWEQGEKGDRGNWFLLD